MNDPLLKAMELVKHVEPSDIDHSIRALKLCDYQDIELIIDLFKSNLHEHAHHLLKSYLKQNACLMKFAGFDRLGLGYLVGDWSENSLDVYMSWCVSAENWDGVRVLVKFGVTDKLASGLRWAQTEKKKEIAEKLQDIMQYDPNDNGKVTITGESYTITSVRMVDNNQRSSAHSTLIST